MPTDWQASVRLLEAERLVAAFVVVALRRAEVALVEAAVVDDGLGLELADHGVDRRVDVPVGTFMSHQKPWISP